MAKGEGERRERGENPSSFRMEFRADGTLRFYQRIQQPNDGLSFLILRSFFYFFFFSSFLFPLAPKPSPIYDAPRALVDISPDRLKNHYRETISWEGEARGTRGKYLDGFNRGSFKSQRREPPVHRACLSSETSEGDKIDRRPLPFIPRSARNYEGFARPKSSMLDAFFISRANAREIDGDRGVRATAIYFTLYFKV